MAQTKRVDNVRSRGSDDSAKGTADRDVLKVFKERIKDAQPFCREQWEKWEENHRFAAGGKSQWNAKAYERRERTGRATFTLNDCGLASRAVSGWEITARFEPTFISRDASDGDWTEGIRDAVRYIRQRAAPGGGAENVESDAFRDLAIGSYSVVEWEQRYDNEEPRGWAAVETPPLWEYMWDPRAREICLVDRAWDARGYFVDVDEFLMMFPDRADEVRRRLDSDKKGWYTREMEQRVEYRHPWSGYALKNAYLQPNRRLIFLVDYEWKEIAPAWVTNVPPGTEPHPVGPDDWEKVCAALQIDPFQAATMLIGPDGPQMVDSFRPMLQQAAAAGLIDPGVAELAVPRMMKMDKLTWERYSQQAAQATGQVPDAAGPESGQRQWVRKSATIAGDDVLRVRQLPFRHFPKIFLTGVPVKQMDGTRMQSVVEEMKEPQKFKNFVSTMAASLLQRSPKMGAITRANALEEMGEALEEKIAQPGFILNAKPGVDPETALHWIDGPGWPSGLDRFLDLANQATWLTTGLNPNILGNLQDPRRVSGVVWNQQVEAVTKVLAWEFNSLRTLRAIEGELLADFIAEYWEPEDLRRVLGPARAAMIPARSEWRDKLRYDAVVAEVPIAKSAQEEAWEYLTRQGIDRLVQLGILPPWVVVEMMPDGWISTETRKKIFRWQDMQGTGPNSMPQQQQPPGGGQAPPEEGQ